MAEGVFTFVEDVAAELGIPISDIQLANALDERDSLSKYRSEFSIPRQDAQDPGSEEVAYFCGNSLGLKPHKTTKYIQRELEKWEVLGVDSHFETDLPWMTIDEVVKSHLAAIVGASPEEVCVMNSLTVNIHLMMVSFYQPTPERRKIMIEACAFPSDYHVVISQLQFHGYNPEADLIKVEPREGENTLRTEDIVSKIQEHGNEIALILFSGVQYLTGQFFDIEAIAKAGHDAGCIVGFDLAHAVGNVELSLHEWEVDFACWCSYKYLNASPGGISGCFVHEKYALDTSRPRFSGWWGHRKTDRFEMKHEFIPTPGASGYMLSNPPVLLVVSLLASLELFSEAGMRNLRAKSVNLTHYLKLLLNEVGDVSVITPSDPNQRGCQLSLKFAKPARAIYDRLQQSGVIVDLREPDIIRVSPVPLYNSFGDVRKFIHELKTCLQE